MDIVNIKAYIASGILESFVLGTLDKEQVVEVENMALQYAEVMDEIRRIQQTLEGYATLHQMQPTTGLKNEILNSIEQYEANLPPELTLNSKPEDYAKWINDPTIEPPEDFDNMYAHPIGKRPNSKLFVLWIRNEEKIHKHDTHTELAMVIEGTCIMHINGEDIPYKTGDIVEMPPGTLHGVTVTSDTPMMAIFMQKAS